MENSYKEVQEKLETKMSKTISVLREELNTVRAGRANAAILDRVTANYYGTETPIKQMANISIPEPRTILIQPFDPKAIPDIEKGINIANIGINPSNDGKVIRLSIPPVTEERRKELIKTVKKMGEDAKVAIRNERRDANDALKKLEKEKAITEDDLKTQLDNVQNMTDKNSKLVDQIIAEKDKEVMEV